MKKLGLVLLAVAVLASFAFAGDDATPKTKSGDKAWMFSFNGLSNLGAGNYWGNFAGLKYYWQDNMALRVGLGFAGSSNSANTNNPMSFGITAGVENNYSTMGAVSAYYGAQLTYWSNRPLNSTNTASTFGLAAVAGVNWFLWNNVSLTPEYQLGFTSFSPGGGGNSTSNYGINSAGNFTISWFF